ncbi:tetratricopeptide repeat protein [Robertkochia solimangrovi]|uniref:tetratricopeptide repeat protein n=1 Tax=Robertkochia solimangrovi TaxID=2213046 RepID=UPI00117D3640|nr:tetratricopeptide repeat protein [Robertkochia solimangrovi]TRZ42726.1 hypothetical protein DMZ48_11675 [Robertkochia solimangrovi]
MNLTHKLCLSIFTLSLSGISAQQSKIYTYNGKDFQEGLELYNNKQYQASQAVFRNVLENTEDEEMQANASYYIANAAIRTNQLGAEDLMETFVERYPTSTKRNSAYMDVADYYFGQGKYPNALRWYNKAEDQGMSNGEREEFNFKKGYALFASRNYRDARSYLDKVSASKKYGSQAKYYIGYMAYQSDDYNQANRYFDQVSSDQELSENLSYYQADMNFKLGNFDKAIALAKEQLAKADRKEASELNKIIGESYFNKGEYEAAIPYLKEYKGSGGKWNNTDYYQLGYAYYKQGAYAEAIGQFNKIIDGSNFVAQNAYYHLAECYLKLDQKQQALNAFRNSANMTFDDQISRDAWLNYARLSYEIGNPYESVPGVLMAYIEKYPDSQHKDEIGELLVDSYITSKNYEQALDLLENNKSFRNKAAYQKVAFYHGLELFNEGNYQAAGDYLQRSLKEPQQEKYTARATFWKAECDYLTGDYNEALIGYKQFEQMPAAIQTEEYEHLNYNLGYCYFKQKNYESAGDYFKKYVAVPKENQAREKDAWLRLGDSNFATSQYWPAMEAYNKVIAMGGGGSDYAYFQKALSYGFVNRGADKVKNLEDFVRSYPNSTLKDDALYELGNTYVNANNSSAGIEAYRKLEASYPMSSFVPKAILREGLVYYNNGENEKALERFKKVVRDYNNTPEAVQAVETAKLIYVDEGRVNEYAAWVKQLDFVEVTDAELDNASFESAERNYVENNYDRAIKGLSAYLSQFPNGRHALKANYYLAQIYTKQNNPSAATPYYEKIVTGGQNDFTEESLARLGDIYLNAKNTDKAIPLLIRLEQSAGYEQNRIFAQSNLMKAYYETGNYPKTLEYAERVLSNASIDDRIKSDAWVMIARSSIKTGNETKARQAYEKVAQVATGSLAAEALYYDAYFKNQDGDYEGSNAAAQQLAQKYASYKETGGKGLIIMAKNFYALDDAFQASYILESVIENFKDYPEIVEDAKKELMIVKSKESQRNSSINPNQN